MTDGNNIELSNMTSQGYNLKSREELGQPGKIQHSSSLASNDKHDAKENGVSTVKVSEANTGGAKEDTLSEVEGVRVENLTLGGEVGGVTIKGGQVEGLTEEVWTSLRREYPGAEFVVVTDQ